MKATFRPETWPQPEKPGRKPGRSAWPLCLAATFRSAWNPWPQPGRKNLAALPGRSAWPQPEKPGRNLAAKTFRSAWNPEKRGRNQSGGQKRMANIGLPTFYTSPLPVLRRKGAF